MSLKTRMRTLKRNKWRYAAMTFGFFLLVAPFSLLGNAVIWLAGANVAADVHTFCYRLPFEWMINWNSALILTEVAGLFVLSLLIVAFLAGPLFCGWLCPAGGLSEAVSRISPIPDRYKLSVRDPRLTATIRAGFLFGFMSLSFAIAYGLLAPAASASLGGIADRFCTSTLLQDFAYIGMGDFSVIAAWTLGSVITLVFWLGIGGLFFKGGRGFCSFFCPLGAASGLMHRAGAKLGLLRVEFQPSKCVSCKKCQVRCPMNAVAEDHQVERGLCISCQECTKACHKQAYAYVAGRPQTADSKQARKAPEMLVEIEE